MIFTNIVLFALHVILEIAGFKLILIEFFVCKSLASKPVDCTGNEFLFDILTKLIIELQAFFDIGASIILVVIVFISGWLRRGEKVKEGLRRDRFLDYAGLLCGCEYVSKDKA